MAFAGAAPRAIPFYLFIAVVSGHLFGCCSAGIAALLLEAGADPNVRVAGQSAAHRAAEKGNEGVVAALLQCGRTQWAARDSSGRTPRQLAAEAGHAEVLRLLDASGAQSKRERGTERG